MWLSTMFSPSVNTLFRRGILLACHLLDKDEDACDRWSVHPIRLCGQVAKGNQEVLVLKVIKSGK